LDQLRDIFHMEVLPSLFTSISTLILSVCLVTILTIMLGLSLFTNTSKQRKSKMIVKIVTKHTDKISVEIQVNKEDPNMIVKIVTKDRQN
jgi:hypothetical protein